MSVFEHIGDVNVCESKIFEWKISNFLSLSAKKDDYYVSPSFSFSNNSFRLLVYPRGQAQAKSGFISVLIENENKRSCYVSYKLSIKKSDGTIIRTMTDTNVNIKTNMGYLNFCELSLLKQNDTLVCTLKLDTDEKKDIDMEKHLHDKKVIYFDRRQLTEFITLSENLKNLFANKESCDTVLNVKDKEYKAHRALLIARSSVFASMFLHDTSEKQTGIVNISDCDPDTFEKFLEFLYSGKLEKVEAQSALHLYETSAKYDVQELKTFSVESLIQDLTAENFCDVVIVADKYDDEKFLVGAQCFFNENLSKVLETPAWRHLMENYSRLANKLLIEMAKVKVEVPK